MFTIDEYIEAKRLGARHAGRAASVKTLASYAWALKKIESLTGKPIDTLTEQDAEVLLTIMDRKGLATATRAQMMAAGRGVFDWAIATSRYDERHPFDGIAAPTIKRVLPTILTKDQVQTFFQSFDSVKYHVFFSLMYYCGLRIGEVASLTRTNVKENYLIIRGKGEKERKVPVPHSVWLLLQRYMAVHTASDYVFYASQTNEPMTLNAAYAAFHRAKEVCGLPAQLHPHNLRHTSATHLQRSSRDITITQKFLGHANPATTMLYAQIADEDVMTAHQAAFGD